MTAPTIEDRVAERRATAANGKPARAAKLSQSPEVEKPLIDSLTPTAVQAEEKRPTVYRPGVLVKPLTSIYEMVGGFVILADPVCGQAIIESADGCARSLDELARTNPAVRRVLMRMIQSGAVTQVIVAHLPILMAVMAHHFPGALKAMTQIFMTAPKADDSVAN